MIETEIGKLTAAAERIAAALEDILGAMNDAALDDITGARNEQNGQNPAGIEKPADIALKMGDAAAHAKPATPAAVPDISRDAGTTVTTADVQREAHAAYGRLTAIGHDQGGASAAIRAAITAFAPNLTEVPAHQLPDLLTRISGLGI